MSGYSGNNSFNYWWNTKSLKVPGLEYDHFVMQPGYGVGIALEGKLAGVMVRRFGSTRRATLTGSVATLGSAPKMKSAMAADAVNNVEFQSELVLTEGKADELSDDEMLPEASADLRTNLAETAFFYPQLRTNEQGEISFSFTMPESLTRWNFRGYSHHISILFRRTKTEYSRMGSIKFHIFSIEPYHRFYRRTLILNREKNCVSIKIGRAHV